MKCTLQNEAGPIDSMSKRSSDLQHLQHGEAARRRQRHAADAMPAIAVAHRRTHLDAVAGEIGERDVARVGRVRAHRIDDVLRDGAAVERVGAFGGDAPQRLRVTRIAQRSSLPRAACPPHRGSTRWHAVADGSATRSSSQDAATPRSRRRPARSPARTAFSMPGGRDGGGRSRAVAPCRARRPSARRPRPPRNPSGLPSRSRKRSGVAAAGAVSRPS